MSNLFKRWGPAALTAAGLLAAPSLLAQTVDGTRDATYPAALLNGVQTAQTSYGDNFTELDNIHAKLANVGGVDYLYLFIGGNLETNFNKLTIFFDTKGGQGQNQLGSNGYFAANFNGLHLDNTVTADYVLSVGANSTTAYVNFLDLPTLGGGNNGGFLGGDYLGSVALGGGTFAFPDGSVGELAINNSNTAGVTGGSGAGSAAAAAAVGTGIEWRIPLSGIGTTLNGGDIKITAVAGQQRLERFLEPDPRPGAGIGRLGSPGSLNLTTKAGNQYVTVANGGSAAPASIALSPSALNFFNVAANGGIVTRTVMVSNNGTAPLHVTSITSNNAAFTVSPTVLNIGNGGSASVTVRFNPSSATAQSGLLTFNSNDLATPAKTLIVSGRGIAGGQIVLDGRRDTQYGAGKAFQTNATSFGDNQAELDGAFARVVGSDLYLMLTGNLYNTSNKSCFSSTRTRTRASQR